MASTKAVAPPHDTYAEQAALGAAMVNDSALLYVVEHLVPEDFWMKTERRIFAAIVTLFALGRPVDQVTVAAEFEGEPETRVTVHALADACPAVTSIREYVRVIKDLSLKRQVREMAQRLITQEPDANGEALLELAQVEAFRINNHHEDFIVPVKAALNETLLAVDEMEQGKRHPGLPSGYQTIDGLIGGLRPGTLNILAARPGVGKTSLALGISSFVAVHNQGVLFFSLEMSRMELAQRIFAANCNVPTNRFIGGGLNGEQRAKVDRFAASFADAPLTFVDEPVMTPSKLRTVARRVHMRMPLSLIVVDYLQLMSDDSWRKDGRQQEVADISRQLKQQSREMNVPIIALSQLNRSPEMRADKKPVLSDLRESGAIEQDADLVLFLHQDSDRTDNRIEVICAKHRMGPTGERTMAFDKTYTKFSDLYHG